MSIKTPHFRDLADWSETSPAQLVAAHLQRVPNTARGYAADLDAAASWLRVGSRVEAAKLLLDRGRSACKRALLAWIIDMRGKALAANTIRRRVAAVMSLIAMAQDLEVIAWSVGKLPLPPPIRVRDVEGPSREVVTAMLETSQVRNDAKGSRDKCIIGLLYWEALRASEVLSIRVQDVDEARDTIRIIGKRGHGRESMRVCQVTGEAVRDWIGRRGREAGPLFTTCPQGAKAYAKPLSYWGLRNVVRLLGAAAGAKVWPHALRHSALTHLAERSSDSPAWGMALSRHRDVKAWAAYQDRKVSHVSASEILSRGTYVRHQDPDK